MKKKGQSSPKIHLIWKNIWKLFKNWIAIFEPYAFYCLSSRKRSKRNSIRKTKHSRQSFFQILCFTVEWMRNWLSRTTGKEKLNLLWSSFKKSSQTFILIFFNQFKADSHLGLKKWGKSCSISNQSSVCISLQIAIFRSQLENLAESNLRGLFIRIKRAMVKNRKLMN